MCAKGGLDGACHTKGSLTESQSERAIVDVLVGIDTKDYFLSAQAPGADKIQQRLQEYLVWGPKITQALVV